MKNEFDMKVYKKIYKEIIKALTDEVECGQDELLKSKDEDCFSARMALCYCMSEHITDGEICKLTGLSQQIVSRNKILFPSRKRQSTTIRIFERIINDTIDRQIAIYKQTTSTTQPTA